VRSCVIDAIRRGSRTAADAEADSDAWPDPGADPLPAVQRSLEWPEACREVLRAVDGLDRDTRRTGWQRCGGAAELGKVSYRDSAAALARSYKLTTREVVRFERALDGAVESFDLTVDDLLALMNVLKRRLDEEFAPAAESG